MSKQYRYSTEQVEKANSIIIAPFIEARGFTLKRSGSELMLMLPGRDRITIRGNCWYSHYEKRGGQTVSLIQRLFGCDFKEAMEMLIGSGAELPTVSAEVKQQMSQKKEKKEEKEFVLPRPNADNRWVYEYLTKTRLLDSKIVQHFIDQGQIYESAESHGNHYVHNLVLVGKDGNGTPRQAHIKGIMPGSEYRRNAEGSDARYGFAHFGQSNRLFVFEAAIDLMSFLSIYQYHWSDHSYIALDGTAEPALLTTLDEHPHLNQVSLCLDHDAGGQLGVFRLQNILLNRGLLADVICPKLEKDWNEHLRHMNFQTYVPASDHPLLCTMESEFQNLIDRGMIQADKVISMDQLEFAIRRFAAWSETNDPQLMARPLRTAALYAGVHAKEQLRHIGVEMDQTQWKIRLFNEMNWPSDKRTPSNYVKDLQHLVNSLSRQAQPMPGWDVDEKKQLANEFIQMTAKCMALSAYYEYKYQQSLEGEVMPCQTQSC